MMIDSEKMKQYINNFFEKDNDVMTKKFVMRMIEILEQDAEMM